MTRCKSKILQILEGLFMLTIVSIPHQVLAFTLEASNDNEKTLSIAVLYYDDDVERWVTRGWYNVPSGSIKTFEFSNSNGVGYVYLYAMSGDRQWYPTNYADGSDFLGRTVIGKAFKYQDGQECPDGPNRRSVAFSKTSIDNGMVSMSWQ